MNNVEKKFLIFALLLPLTFFQTYAATQDFTLTVHTFNGTNSVSQIILHSDQNETREVAQVSCPQENVIKLKDFFSCQPRSKELQKDFLQGSQESSTKVQIKLAPLFSNEGSSFIYQISAKEEFNQSQRQSGLHFIECPQEMNHVSINRLLSCQFLGKVSSISKKVKNKLHQETLKLLFAKLDTSVESYDQYSSFIDSPDIVKAGPGAALAAVLLLADATYKKYLDTKIKEVDEKLTEVKPKDPKAVAIEKKLLHRQGAQGPSFPSRLPEKKHNTKGIPSNKSKTVIPRDPEVSRALTETQIHKKEVRALKKEYEAEFKKLRESLSNHKARLGSPQSKIFGSIVLLGISYFGLDHLITKNSENIANHTNSKFTVENTLFDGQSMPIIDHEMYLIIKDSLISTLNRFQTQKDSSGRMRLYFSPLEGVY